MRYAMGIFLIYLCILLFLVFILCILFFLVFIRRTYRIEKYKASSYYQENATPYYEVLTNKGKYGEYSIYQELSYLENNGARFLFNLYVPSTENHTSEIDVVLICHSGIFVFESKNYRGWIFGREENHYWYQCVYSRRGSQKHKFYNPLIQNQNHIRYIKQVIGHKFPVYSIIAFSDRCTFKNIQLTKGEHYVVHYSVLPEVISHFPYNALNDIQIETIYNILYPYTKVDDSTKLKHMNSASSNKKSDYEIQYSNQRDFSSNTRCPLCGGRLILRTAQKGVYSGKTFYGCSNYPRCKYLKNI